MKKFIKILGIAMLLFVALLVATPFFLESKIDSIVKNYAKNNLNADLTFKKVHLSLISSFPNAEVHVEDLKIDNRDPFKGETLATAKAISVKMPIRELFKSKDEPLAITEVMANELLLTLKSNQNGTTNYDILVEKPTEPTENEISEEGFSFDIKTYGITNSALTYINAQNNTVLYLTEVNHKGKGIFSENLSELDTQTSARVSLSVDSMLYLNNTSTKLDALIDLDLDNNTYSFKDNSALINALPVEFSGYVKGVDSGQVMALKFRNPRSSFRDFLAVIPAEYAQNLEKVNTTGDFLVNGEINGLLSDRTIPKFNISITSNNASFKYPSLPKKVENITIDTEIINTTGLFKDTYVDVNAFNFRIDQDLFNTEAHISNLGDNTQVKANLNGTLNLANISKAYPIKLKNQLTGILRCKLTTDFDMNAIKSNNYTRIRNNGNVAVSNFVFSSKDIVNPIQINTANLNFSPGLVQLNNFDAITGSSDFSANGSIRNLLGFLLSDKTLKGNFNVKSKSFTISDFMVQNTKGGKNASSESLEIESLKIPDFLDCVIKADAQKVFYDNLTLTNVKGELHIKDQKAELINMTSEIFEGTLAMSGTVNTREKQPTFDINLGMKGFNISQSIKNLKMLKAIVPVANILQGKLNAGIDMSGLLDNSFSPDLNTIVGSANAKLMTSKINTSASPVLTGLSNQLKFINLNDLNLRDVDAQLSFKDGQVFVEPFAIQYKDIPVNISGSHSFGNQMNYTAKFQVPAKYLGSDVNRLIGQIDDEKINSITVPINAMVSGTFSQPKITTDLTASIGHLTQQLLEIQKQKLINKGTTKVNAFIDDLLGGQKVDTTAQTPKPTDSLSQSSKEEIIKKEANSLFNKLLKKKPATEPKQKKDSVKNG